MKPANKQKLVQLIAKTSFQPLMQRLYLLGLTGMNYANANALDYENTGELKVIEFVKKKLEPHSALTLFDVGANTGNYSGLMAKQFGAKAAIYAFEPIKHTFGQLLRGSAGKNNIRCFHFAFGEKEETKTIYANFEGSGATTFYPEAVLHYRSNKNFSEQIEIKTIDGFCRQHSIDTIDFLKIDVEGHELPVLCGAARMLGEGNIKFIQFEFGPFHIYARTFFRDFWNLLSPRYTIYRVIRDGLFEIKKYSESLEIFRTANFLAELRS